MDLMKRLSKAKTGLILDHPFVGTIAMNMPFSLDESVGTAATNGKRVVFAPNFIEPLTDDELLFVVAHECFHPMLEHCYRLLGRNPYVWNQAGDYVINQLLVDDKIGKMPDSGLQDKAIYDEGGGSTDGVYAILPPEPEGGGGQGGWQDCEDSGGTQAEKDQDAAQMKVQVAQAAQAAKMCGKLTANQARLVDEILNPKVDWRDVLQRFVEKCRTDSRTFARPSRRFAQQGMYLPSRDGEAMGEIVLAVDCSGSVGDEELAQFKAEAQTIFEDQKPKRLHIIFFESSVSGYDVMGRDDEFVFNPRGCGGTAFSPIFKKIQEEAVEPVACVVLTDLHCSDFGEQPEYPVLWVTYGAEKAPWGEVTSMV